MALRVRLEGLPESARVEGLEDPTVPAGAERRFEVVVKVPSTPEAPELGIWHAYEEAGLDAPESLIHGTTIATNALLERRGVRTALVITAGFAEMGAEVTVAAFPAELRASSLNQTQRSWAGRGGVSKAYWPSSNFVPMTNPG